MHHLPSSTRPRRSASDRARNCSTRRAALVKVLGGACSACGSRSKLEFHHPAGRDWEPRKTSRWARIKRYEQEAASGLLAIKCRHCNAVEGRPL